MNEDKNPYERLMDEIADLLQFVQGKSQVPLDDSKLSPEVIQAFQNIRKKVAEFRKLGEEVVSLSGATREEVLMHKGGLSRDTPPAVKRVIEKGELLKGQIKELQGKLLVSNITEAEQGNLPKGKQETEFEKIKQKKDDSFGKKRRSKFKSLGGDKDWKPL